MTDWAKCCNVCGIRQRRHRLATTNSGMNNRVSYRAVSVCRHAPDRTSMRNSSSSRITHTFQRRGKRAGAVSFVHRGDVPINAWVWAAVLMQASAILSQRLAEGFSASSGKCRRAPRISRHRRSAPGRSHATRAQGLAKARMQPAERRALRLLCTERAGSLRDWLRALSEAAYEENTCTYHDYLVGQPESPSPWCFRTLSTFHSRPG